MISKVVCIAVFSVLHQQARGTITYCDCEIECAGRDPECALTEVRRSVYREYESVKRELRTAGRGGDASGDVVERQSLLDGLEAARYELDEYLNELNAATLRRMRTAYAERGRGGDGDGDGDDDGYARAVDGIWTEAEAQLRPRLTAFRQYCTRPRSLIGGVLGGVLGGAGSVVRGLVGGGGRLL